MQRKRISLENHVTDFRTGEVITMTKEKPITNYKGVATLQLFNALTGELELEAVTENVIMEWLVREAFYNTFIRAIQSNANSSWRLGQPFNYLLLTTSTKVEEDTEQYIDGDLVGWANRATYSGDDAYRGSLNTAESSYNNIEGANKIRVHLVFDFPTHAANGTIRSLYWVSNFDTQSSVHQFRGQTQLLQDAPYASSDSWNFIRDAIGSCYSNARYWNEESRMYYSLGYISNCWQYIVFDTSVPECTAADGIKLKYSDGSAMTTQLPRVTSYFDFASNRIKILFYTYSSSSYKDMPKTYTFYEWTFTMQGAFVSIKSFSRDLFKLASNNAYLYRVDVTNTEDTPFYYDDNGKLHVCSSWFISSTEYKQVDLLLSDDLQSIASQTDMRPVIAEALNLYARQRHWSTRYDEKSSEVIKSNIRFYGVQLKDLDRYYITNSGVNDGWWLLHRNTKKPILTEVDRYFYTYPDYRYEKPARGSNTILATYNNGNNYFLRRPIFQVPSAHTLLPSNVVKTDVNTMKIQYDFIVDTSVIFKPVVSPTEI